MSPASPASSGASHEDRHTGMVFLRHRAGLYLGNKAFSFAGFPSLWSWQIAWWILGIVMMWALCFKAEMSTTNETQIQRAEKETNIVIKEA
jgi:SSS family solute:Na+ symporter